jgi:hypothetical protein
MKKLTTTMASALAVLLLASGAWAWESDLDYDHISRPEDGYYVFWNEEEMNEFLDELAEAKAVAEYEEQIYGETRACWVLRPVVDYAWTMHDEGEETAHWHVTTYVTWDGQLQEYQVHESYTDGHMWDSVDQIKVRWRDNDGGWYCDYCDDYSWNAYYKKGSIWRTMDSYNCFHYSGAVYYYGSETSDYDDYDMLRGRYAKFSCSAVSSYLALAY